MAKEDKNGKVLKNPNGTTIDLLDLSDDRVESPNISRVVQKEVQRLQREIIEDMKEVVLAEITFDSIDYIPESDIIVDDRERDFFRSEFNKVYQDINTRISQGNSENPDNINMKQYLKLFNVTYDSNGLPVVTFSIKVDNFDGTDIYINPNKINIKSSNNTAVRRTGEE